MKIWEVSRTKNSKPGSRSFADKFWPLEVRVMNLGDSILYLVTFLIGCAAGSTLMFLWFRPQLERTAGGPLAYLNPITQLVLVRFDGMVRHGTEPWGARQKLNECNRHQPREAPRVHCRAIVSNWRIQPSAGGR